MPETALLAADIKMVLDITSRVDERVKIIVENQTLINQRLNQFIDEHNKLAAKVAVMESLDNRLQVRTELNDIQDDLADSRGRIEALERHRTSLTEKIKSVSSLVMQAIFVVVMGYVLLKLGLPASSLP